MRRGKVNLGDSRRPFRSHFAWGLAAALGCVLVGGCRNNPNRANVEKNLLNERPTTGHRHDIVGKYTVACPDVLELHVEQRSELNGLRTVGPDGCVNLGGYGPVRVEGLTLPAVSDAVAEKIAARPEAVHVRVVEFASRRLILIGEVTGRHRSVTYQGGETVLDVLQRVGGITPGAEPTEIYVVRSHIGDLQRPEVFHVDLQAIVLNRDHETNVRVEPYDQIYVGETRQARIEKCIPPWLRPTYQKFWNMLPTGKTPQESYHSFTDWMRGLLPFTDPAADPPATAKKD